MQPTAVHSMHVYEVRPRKEKHGVEVDEWGPLRVKIPSNFLHAILVLSK